MAYRGDYEKLFKNIIEPNNFIQNFKDEKEFCEWLDMGSVEDLECTLKVFEKAELYSICSIINKYIKENC